MSFSAVEIPAQTRAARKPKITEAEAKELVRMLKKGETPSDGVLYTEPTKSGKQGPRTVSYMAAYSVRAEVLHAEPSFNSKTLSIRTWQDGEGFRWALVLKTAKK